MRGYSSVDLGKQISDKKAKKHLIDMLDVFDAFCKKHGLKYYLSGGTLLGAIRNGKIIPWDDDIDINMSRPDCEKLFSLSSGKIEDLTLVPPNCGYYRAYHYKLYNEKILVNRLRNGKLINSVTPIFIDIFPIDGLPNSSIATIAYYRKLRSLKRKVGIRLSNLKKSYSPFRYIVNKTRKFLNIKKAEKFFNKIISKQKSIDFNTAHFVGVTSTNVHQEEERMVKENYVEQIYVTLEGKKYPAPKDYNFYLTSLYGRDYMTLPPLEKRFSLHSFVFYENKNQKKLNIFNENNSQEEFQTKSNKKINIAILGLIKSENIGELFIADSLKYLIKQQLNKKSDLSAEFTYVDVLARKDEIINNLTGKKYRDFNYFAFNSRVNLCDLVFYGLKRLNKKISFMPLSNFFERIRFIVWSISRNYKKRLNIYFDKKLKDINFIVIDGAGLLEYQWNEYQWSLFFLTKYAEKNNIPIVYNAIGQAGEVKPTDFRTSLLSKAINSKQVKYISTRDSNDKVTLLLENKSCVLRADAAFWLKETYGVKNKIKPKRDKKLIGIGLIRLNSLLGYNVNYKPNSFLLLFKNIAEELLERGYDFEFFTNGLTSDIVAGKTLLEVLDLPNDKLVERPIYGEELYETISNYDAIITCRMHSCIAAYTLGIPSLVLSWNDKVDKLNNIIGYPNRVVSLENFDSTFVVNKLEEIIKEGVDEKKVLKMKELAEKSVSEYVDLIIKEGEKKC